MKNVGGMKLGESREKLKKSENCPLQLTPGDTETRTLVIVDTDARSDRSYSGIANTFL